VTGADYGYEKPPSRPPSRTNNPARKWRWLFQVILHRSLLILQSNWAWSGESLNKTAFLADEKPLRTKSSAAVVRYRRAVVLEIACGFDCLWKNTMKWNNDKTKMHSYIRIRVVCQRPAKRCFWGAIDMWRTIGNDSRSGRFTGTSSYLQWSCSDVFVSSFEVQNIRGSPGDSTQQPTKRLP
jgi:hypothetical protein